MARTPGHVTACAGGGWGRAGRCRGAAELHMKVEAPPGHTGGREVAGALCTPLRLQENNNVAKKSRTWGMYLQRI